MDTTRRDSFGLLGGAAISAAAGSLLWPQCATADPLPVESLREVASERGLMYGSCSGAPGNVVDYDALIVRQCALFAPSLDWQRVSPGPDNALTWEDPGAPYFVNKGLKLTGYHLTWHQTAPKWFLDIQSTQAAEKAVQDHITAMGARYGKDTYSWNVVNEALNPKEGRPDNLRNESPFTQKMGIHYFDVAFRAARQAAPGATRVYNDYDLETDNPDVEVKRKALLRLLDYLHKQRAPIDAVGLQSHLRLQYSFDEKRYRAFLHEIASRGLKILITELDVFDVGAPADIAQRDQIVADLYSRFLNATLDERAVKAVVNWGLSDLYTWLGPNYSKAFARPDGLPQRPLPFDADLKPKPAFYAIVNAFKAAPKRAIG